MFDEARVRNSTEEWFRGMLYVPDKEVAARMAQFYDVLSDFVNRPPSSFQVGYYKRDMSRRPHQRGRILPATAFNVDAEDYADLVYPETAARLSWMGKEIKVYIKTEEYFRDFIGETGIVASFFRLTGDDPQPNITPQLLGCIFPKGEIYSGLMHAEEESHNADLVERHAAFVAKKIQTGELRPFTEEELDRVKEYLVFREGNQP